MISANKSAKGASAGPESPPHPPSLVHMKERPVSKDPRKRVAARVAKRSSLRLGILRANFGSFVSGPALQGIFALPEPGWAHRMLGAPYFERVLYFGGRWPTWLMEQIPHRGKFGVMWKLIVGRLAMDSCTGECWGW